MCIQQSAWEKLCFMSYNAHPNFISINKVVGLNTGAAPQFSEWGYKYCCDRSEQKKFGGCTPTYDIPGYYSCKESLSVSVSREYACYNIFLTGHAFIGIPNDLQDSTNRRQKECCAAQKAKYYTQHHGQYRSDGDISDVWTLISLIYNQINLATTAS